MTVSSRRGEQRGAHALGVRGVAEHVDPRVGRDQAHGRPADLPGGVRVLLGGQLRCPGELARPRPEQRQLAALERALVQVGAEADEAVAQRVEDRLERDALHVQQQLVPGVQDPQLAEHLALRRQHGRKLARPGRERRDVVRDDAVERLRAVLAGDRQPAAVPAVDQRGAVAQGGAGGIGAGDHRRPA